MTARVLVFTSRTGVHLAGQDPAVICKKGWNIAVADPAAHVMVLGSCNAVKDLVCESCCYALQHSLSGALGDVQLLCSLFQRQGLVECCCCSDTPLTSTA